MAEKRRDNKGRILRTGESQRKDGRYAYKYTDSTGKPQFVYAWKLVSTDKTPAGKRDDISLRCQRQCNFVVFRRTENVEKWRVKVYSHCIIILAVFVRQA